VLRGGARMDRLRVTPRDHRHHNSLSAFPGRIALRARSTRVTRRIVSHRGRSPGSRRVSYRILPVERFVSHRLDGNPARRSSSRGKQVRVTFGGLPCSPQCGPAHNGVLVWSPQLLYGASSRGRRTIPARRPCRRRCRSSRAASCSPRLRSRLEVEGARSRDRARTLARAGRAEWTSAVVDLEIRRRPHPVQRVPFVRSLPRVRRCQSPSPARWASWCGRSLGNDRFGVPRPTISCRRRDSRFSMRCAPKRLPDSTPNRSSRNCISSWVPTIPYPYSHVLTSMYTDDQFAATR